MLTPAHVAASYLLSQVPQLFNQPLTSQQVSLIIVAGNVVDLDFVWGLLKGKKGDDHHNLITHTPICTLLVWLVLVVAFSSSLNDVTWLLILISSLIHLILDDIGYWFCRMGWQEISKYPQINWFYPLKDFRLQHYKETNLTLLKEYFSKAKVNVLFEVMLITAASIVFLTQALQ